MLPNEELLTSSPNSETVLVRYGLVTITCIREGKHDISANITFKNEGRVIINRL